MKNLYQISKNIYTIHKEKILYLIFGILTTILNYIVFYIFNLGFGMAAWLSNTFAWVVAVTFAYVTNKFWVFESKSTAQQTIIREIIAFIGARLLSLGVSVGIVFIFIDWLGFNSIIQTFIVLTGANVIVVILNYFASKYFIFTKNSNNSNLKGGKLTHESRKN